MKDIKNYEGLYAIDESGNVWGYKRKHFLTPMKDKDGYLKVGLSKDNKKKKVSIHRLVAEAFIDNPLGLPQVNHKDENKQNNRVDNLEWCDAKYNNTYGTRIERSIEKTYKPVYCEELDRTFKSQIEAARELGLYKQNISACCKGRLKTTGGYHFRYAEVA